jgi:hypothetical protein
MAGAPVDKTTNGQNAGSLLDEQVTELKKAGLSATARAIIWAVGSLVVLAVSGWGFYLRDYFNRQFPQLPANALIAFMDACPDSTWENLAERDPSAAGAYLRIASQDVQARGGENEHKLAETEIPKLQLFSTQDVGQSTPALWGLSGVLKKDNSLASRDGGVSGAALFEFKTLFVGTSASAQIALKIQPKYISVVLCRKRG